MRQATGKFISEVWLLGNSTLEGFESVSLPLLAFWQLARQLHAWAPEEIASLTLVCRLFLAGSTRVAVILNPPAGPLRRFDFDGLVTGSVLVRVLRCCEWQE